MILNIEDAKKEYITTHTGKTIHNPHIKFSSYSPSYVLTNEDVRWVSRLTKNIGEKVLTVTSSGDHALFYSLNGAKKIDTFDISFCTKVAMDIKLAAIKNFTYKQYIEFLIAVHKFPDFSAKEKILDLLKTIPESSAQFINDMEKYPIFSNGSSPEYCKKLMLTEKEFSKLQKKTPDKIGFIWSDINSLHLHLIGEYDVINLSNILEYVPPESISHILISLKPYIKQNHYIIAQTGTWGIEETQNYFFNIAKDFKKWAKIQIIQKNKNDPFSEKVVILQKIR